MSKDSSILHRVATAATDRRTFLAGSGAAGAAVLVAACGSSTSSPSSSSSSASSPTPSGGGDAAVAMTAASLEVLAVATYKAAGTAATAGHLGAVPPAVATFVTTVGAHHQAALDKWNAVLQTAGAPAVTAPPADLNQTVQTAFAAVTDVPGLAKLALMLEKTASDTYLAAGPTLQSKDAITLAGALQIVDQMHAAILYYVLGQYPVPDVFQKTDMAYSPPK
ncbi:MAG: ferritin-like domain-containing protein [Candidatus Dormibacteraeota bacterium]|uniref:Ferritin-like domain-containing protein n=2 Tax=Candidatus Aeolococcus gillhamiae TaxID=3127015 RepID=A0A934K3T2_9BACT|nr:ferritin-like domain-containing protein [Candidatus Dormibacteraeota bacterium]